MTWKVLFAYCIGIVLCQPVYIWSIRWINKMAEREDSANCADMGVPYEPYKPNYPLVIVTLVAGGILWPVALLIALFAPFTFAIMEKMNVFQKVRECGDEVEPGTIDFEKSAAESERDKANMK